MAANDFVYASIPLPTDVPAKNTGGVAVAAGDVVQLDTANLVSGTQATFGVKQSAALADTFGVAMEAIAIGATGRIRTQGIAQVVASAAIAAGAIVDAAASGQVATHTLAKPQLGQALTAAAALNDKILVLIQPAHNA